MPQSATLSHEAQSAKCKAQSAKTKNAKRKAQSTKHKETNKEEGVTKAVEREASAAMEGARTKNKAHNTT